MTKKEFREWWAASPLNLVNRSKTTTLGSPLKIIKKHPLYIGNSILTLSSLVSHQLRQEGQR